MQTDTFYNDTALFAAWHAVPLSSAEATMDEEEDAVDETDTGMVAAPGETDEEEDDEDEYDEDDDDEEDEDDEDEEDEEDLGDETPEAAS